MILKQNREEKKFFWSLSLQVKKTIGKKIIYSFQAQFKTINCILLFQLENLKIRKKSAGINNEKLRIKGRKLRLMVSLCQFD